MSENQQQWLLQNQQAIAVIISHLPRKYRRSLGDDIDGIAMLAACLAAEKHDGRDSHDVQYLRVCIYRAVEAAYRRQRRAADAVQYVERVPDVVAEPPDETVDTEKLNQQDRDIVERVLAGECQHEIAKSLGVSRQRISQRVQRAVQILKGG